MTPYFIEQLSKTTLSFIEDLTLREAELAKKEKNLQRKSCVVAVLGILILITNIIIALIS